MRPLEILSAALLLAATALPLMRLRSRLPFRISCLWMALAVAAQFLFEGPHWQLDPLYCAVLLLLICAVFGHRWQQSWVSVTVVTTLLLLFASGCLSWMMPMFQLPAPTGPFAVGTRILHFVDVRRVEENGLSPSGKRELMVQVWYPAERPSSFPDRRVSYQRRKEVTWRASYRSVLKTNSYQNAPILGGGPYPVLIYNPSWMGERTESTFQMEELASHGFIVIGVDHTFFGGRVEFPDGRVADSRGAPNLGNFERTTVQEEWSLGAKYVHIEAQDDSFVLDQFQLMNRDQACPWFRRIDMSRVGAMGYSIGGAAAEQMAYQDSRVKAALDMDGWSFGDVGTHGLAKPLMVMFEDKEQTIPTAAQLHANAVPEQRKWEFSAEDFANVTSGLRQNGGFLLFIAGTRHVDFSDRSLLSPLRVLTGAGTLNPRRAHSIINAYSLAFFSNVLLGKDEPILRTNPAPFPEVEFEHFAGSQHW